MSIFTKIWSAIFRDKGGTKVSLGHADFGLAMDGVTDDTVAFQGAIDWMTAQGGGELVIPPNTDIVITSPVVLPRSITVDIVGCGRWSRIINNNTEGEPAIKLSDDAVNVSSHFRIQDLRIECPLGGSGILLNNSRDEDALTGTISVTAGSKVVTGSGGTTFTTSLSKATDTIIISGVEYDIRHVQSNTVMEITQNYPGSTASGLSYSRARYGNGSRWSRISDVWLQGPFDAIAGTYGIQAERVNNVKFTGPITIQGFAIGFKALAVNGRSAGCWMDSITVSRSTEISYAFYDCRSFSMFRCRSEGNVPIAMRFELCHAMELFYCSAEDDQTVAGIQWITCERMEAHKSGCGTSFAGGLGWDLQNSDLCTVWGGQVAARLFRAEDYPTTPDTIIAGIKIDASSQGNRFERVAIENGAAALDNASLSTTVTWLDIDGNAVTIVAEAIPTLDKVKTNAGAAITSTTSLSKYDAGVVRVNADGGAFTITLPNASADNIGLRYLFLGEGSADNSVTVARAGTDTIDAATSVTVRRDFAIEVECCESGKWVTIRRTGKRIAGTSTGVGSIKMNNGTAAQNIAWLEVSPGRWVPTWATPTP